MIAATFDVSLFLYPLAWNLKHLRESTNSRDHLGEVGFVGPIVVCDLEYVDVACVRFKLNFLYVLIKL